MSDETKVMLETANQEKDMLESTIPPVGLVTVSLVTVVLIIIGSLALIARILYMLAEKLY